MEDHVLRKLGAALFALPVILVVYLAVLGRRGMARMGAVAAVALAVALVVVAGLPPAPGNAVPVSAAPAPVDARFLGTVSTGHGLKDPLVIEFDAPMEASTVAAALRVQPSAAVEFSWDATGKVLRVAPLTQWQPDTLYVLTVSEAARARDGGQLAKPVRATVLTGRAGTATIEPTRTSGDRARLDSAFRITLDRAATLAAVRAALRTDPRLDGTLTAGDAPNEYVFTPSDPLSVNGTYTVSLEGLTGADGVAFADGATLTIRAAGAPKVVRFRPLEGTDKVDRAAAISVRFTEAMNKDVTADAFTVTVGKARVKGTIGWAEKGTVLVFDPAEALPYGATVVARVGADAVSKSGTPIAKAASAAFTVEAKPKPKPRAAAPSKAGKPKTKPISRGGGGAISGSWTAVEAYYLRLMNCTRTGGWVTAGGDCSSPGGRNVAPIVLNRGISAEVSRPYAKLLATRGICNHFIGGTPGDRLRRAGYTSYRWAENLGCRSGNPYNAVLGSHRFFQSEKPYNGGHYRNMMNADLKQAGIGVWVSGGNVRLVVDFYTP